MSEQHKVVLDKQPFFADSNVAETMTKTKRIGILTAGGDSPGLNAAIRGVGKTALGFYGMEIIGFRDGFRGLVTNRRLKLDRNVPVAAKASAATPTASASPWRSMTCGPPSPTWCSRRQQKLWIEGGTHRAVAGSWEEKGLNLRL